MNEKTYEKHFAKRGISPEVAERRPHARHRKGHPEDIWKWDLKYRDLLTPPQRAAITRNVNQSTAEAFFGPTWAELRPNESGCDGAQARGSLPATAHSSAPGSHYWSLALRPPRATDLRESLRIGSRAPVRLIQPDQETCR